MKVSICGLRAEKARVDHSDLTWGFPSPTAWAGLANAIGRRVTGEDWRTSCIPVIHDQEMRLGRRSPENSGAKGAFSPQGSRPRMEAIIEFSLILTLPDSCEDEDPAALNDRISGALTFCRIAGSPILTAQGRPVRSRLPDGEPLNFEDCAKRSLRRSGLGYMIIPYSRGPLVYRYANELGCLIAASEEGRDEGVHLLPALVGYAMISDPEHRPASRNGLPHVFAEPVSGLVEQRLNTRASEISEAADRGFAFTRRGDEVMVNRAYHNKDQRR